MPDVATLRTPAVLDPEEVTGAAIAAARGGKDALQPLLDSLPVPIYLTDAEGWVTYFNRACADFAGRTPLPGEDRWCVTWRLYTESGAFLPHDQCPMAQAIRDKAQVRGVVAVAERPDGTRVLFTPHPTPITDDAGTLIGAVNILVDVTDRRQAGALGAQAQRCRRLARSVTDQRTVDTLVAMATEYEEKARALNGDRPTS